MPKLIALGANLPFAGREPVDTIGAAIEMLQQHGVTVLDRSHLYATACFPAGAGPDFANAAICIGFDGSPSALLAICHQVEAKFGRERNARWSARTLDIDIVCWDDAVMPDKDTVSAWIEAPLDRQMTQSPDQLILPHPRLHERGFVLVPMADLVPNWVHPILGQSVVDMLKALPEAEITGIKAL